MKTLPHILTMFFWVGVTDELGVPDGVCFDSVVDSVVGELRDFVDATVEDLTLRFVETVVGWDVVVGSFSLVEAFGDFVAGCTTVDTFAFVEDFVVGVDSWVLFLDGWVVVVVELTNFLFVEDACSVEVVDLDGFFVVSTVDLGEIVGVLLVIFTVEEAGLGDFVVVDMVGDDVVVAFNPVCILSEQSFPL